MSHVGEARPITSVIDEDSILSAEKTRSSKRYINRAQVRGIANIDIDTTGKHTVAGQRRAVE